MGLGEQGRAVSQLDSIRGGEVAAAHHRHHPDGMTGEGFDCRSQACVRWPGHRQDGPENMPP